MEIADIRRVIRMERNLDDLLRRTTGLSTRQYDVLSLIGEQPGRLSSDIARTIPVTPTGVTSLVSLMAQQGYVRRDYPTDGSTDRRSIHLHLTEDGKTKLKEADEILKGFDHEKCHEIVTEFPKLAENMRG